MLVFRRPDEHRFHDGRAATVWDPPPADRDAMRTLARHTGTHLRTTLDYRGAFTIDGIMTVDGFRPTELNPRIGAALGLQARSLPDLPLRLLNLALIEGENASWQPRALEALLLDAADTHRAGNTMARVQRDGSDPLEATLVFDGTRFHVDPNASAPDATASLSPADASGHRFLFVTLVPDRVPIGPSAAPRAIAALRCIDTHWQLGLGDFEPAADVRNATPLTPR